MPRAQPPAPRVVLSEREVRTLLDYPDTVTPLGLRDRAILELLYSSALRNSELLGLNLTELDLERREVRVLRGKGDKSRVVPLGEEAARWTAAYIERGRPALDGGQGGLRVFLSSRGKPLVRANLAHMTRRTAVRAGLSKTVTPHVLRHSCATHMLRRGAGLRHLQELLGHASPSTTQRYTKVEISDLQRVHRRYHPRERRAQG